MSARLSFEPIDAHMDARWPDLSVDERADLIGVTGRSVHRWRAAGITEVNADRVAVALGLHPRMLWGPSWDALC